MVEKKKKTRSTSSSVDPATRYAMDVVSGKEIAGPDIRNACKRHLKDLESCHARGLFWDTEAAQRAIDFFAKVLKLNGGEHEGNPFILLPWQCFIVGSIFGWKNSENYRRFRMVYVESGTRERTTNVLTGLLTKTQTFKEGVINLFSTLTQSIIQNLVDMAAQALVTNTILSSIMGVGSSVLGGVGGSTAGSSGTAIADYGSNFQFNAKGGVYSSSDLSAYSGQVVDNPTFFAFAKGAGVMGEAGPEAIMPLTRAADGSLGVRAVSGGASEGAAPQVFITINGDGSTASQSSGGLEKLGKSVGNFVRDEYRKLIQADLRPGGAIWNSTNGRR